MAKTGAATESEQAAPAGADSGAAEEASRRQVRCAFALGWRVAELRYLPRDVRDPKLLQDPLVLVRAPDLDFAMRVRLLVAQICADLDWLDFKWSGGIRLRAADSPANPGADAMPALESIEVPTLVDVDEQHVKSATAEVHPPNPGMAHREECELGKAYSVGVGLASTVLEAYEEVQPALAGGRAETDAGTTLKRVKQCVAKGFTDDRVRELWSEIKDLKSRFPPYAADPIAAGLSDWCKWAGGSRTKNRQPSTSDQILTVSNRLRRQGQILARLLSGERKPTDVLLAANYIDGAIDLVRKYSRLVVRMLGANLGTVLVALFAAAVLGIAVIVLQQFANSFFTWVAGLLAALGVSGAGLLAALKPWPPRPRRPCGTRN